MMEWNNWSPTKRAEFIRSHVKSFPVAKDALQRLFCLSEEGERRILAGDIWRPEYEDQATMKARKKARKG